MSFDTLFSYDNLPTWSEIWDTINPKLEPCIIHLGENDNNEFDPYWHIPKKALHIIQLCNYLNYQLKQYPDLLSNLQFSGAELDTDADDKLYLPNNISFTITPSFNTDGQQFAEGSYSFPSYTFTKGKLDIILDIRMMMHIKVDEYLMDVIGNIDDPIVMKVISYICQDVIDYFNKQE